jgi:FSR family fosmidomycin resistance protein-like MFS transporter
MNGAASRRPASRATLFALTLGHGCADLCSGALFALLPFLVVERHYSYAAAGVFALTASVAHAVFQPLIGAQGDRREAHWLLPAGLIVTGIGIGAVGVATSFPLTLIAVAVCSAGVASYHPEGARWARHASSSRVTADMSVFSVGGGVGYAVGPLVVAAVLAPLGLHGTLVIALIPFTAALLVGMAVRRFRLKPLVDPQRHGQAQARGSEWRPFACLVAMFCVAGGVSTGLLTFVPLFLVEARGASPAASNVMTSILLAAAAAGTLLGGIVAHRYGRRVVLLAPQLILVPAIALLPSLSYVAMIPVVVLIGIAVNANVSVALVLAQEYLPAHMGLATGLTIGLCGGVGGLIVAALGLFGDAAGLSSVLYAIAALPLLVAVLAARLPQPAAAPPGTVWSLRAEAELCRTSPP